MLRQGFMNDSTRYLMIALNAALIFAGLLMIFPFLWSAILATKSNEEIYSTSLSLLPGLDLVKNYNALVDAIPFWTSMWNSVYVSILGTVVSLLFCSLAGYALAIFEFRGRNAIFAIMLGSMMIPPALGLIPYYLIMEYLGLLNSHIAIWLPFTAVPFGIFLIRQYVASSLPKELIEAARLDGASEFAIYWRVAVPLMKPILGTLAIVQFVFFWNNFVIPLIILNTEDMYVVTLALRSLQGLWNSPWGAVMLGTTISVMPILIFYSLASKQMIAGLTAGAVKG